ncbi:MAG TPA: hypothetical protein EYQ50_00195 [Verrucomicrobiales bacterium]|nr:hypothetical protein [Verrucomicrobiales bacterium]
MNKRFIVAFFSVILLLPGKVLACSVPVFRYALERWERDLYQVVVIKAGKFTEEQVELAQSLQAVSVLGEGVMNINVSLADISDPEMRQTLHRVYPSSREIRGDAAELVLFYPKEQGNQTLLWQEDFSQSAVDAFVESAAVLDLMKPILQGTSVVFLMVESGNASKDHAASQLVRETLEALEEQIELPEGVVNLAGKVTGGNLSVYEALSDDPTNQLKSGIPLRIEFELRHLPKNKKAPILRSILLNMDQRLFEFPEEPMLFSIFGRGRVLPPMVGEGISKQNITDAAMYLCGACSCQMKAQNPGIDSLSNVDWFRYLEGSEVIQDKELPLLSGISAMINPDDLSVRLTPGQKDLFAAVSAPGPSEVSDLLPVKTFLFGVGTMALFLTFASIVIIRKISH